MSAGSLGTQSFLAYFPWPKFLRLIPCLNFSYPPLLTQSPTSSASPCLSPSRFPLPPAPPQRAGGAGPAPALAPAAHRRTWPPLRRRTGAYRFFISPSVVALWLGGQFWQQLDHPPGGAPAGVACIASSSLSSLAVSPWLGGPIWQQVEHPPDLRPRTSLSKTRTPLLSKVRLTFRSTQPISDSCLCK